MPVITEYHQGRVPVKVWTDNIQTAAVDQLNQLSNLDIVHHHVAAMPDVHAGIGSTVGSVIATKGAIIPASVGVDIGCGMAAVRLSLTANDLPESLAVLRSSIEAAVPVGFADHDNDKRSAAIRRHAARACDGLPDILDKHPQLQQRSKRSLLVKAFAQLGTLGGGNHFIELCLDEAGNVWVMLHSGSRGIGNVIGSHFIEVAKNDMGVHLANLPDKDLAYLSEGTEHYADYIRAVSWAQAYASHNREVMLDLVLDALTEHLPPFTLSALAVNCHHNYVSSEFHFGEYVHVTRKGAIRARRGELGIIPGSMGAKSYIVQGKGNRESFCSCSHGAGRVMSRGEAKRRFTEADLAVQTQGVECRKDAGVVDEIPGAYKDIEEVMANQRDLVEIVHTLKQVLCIKG